MLLRFLYTIVLRIVYTIVTVIGVMAGGSRMDFYTSRDLRTRTKDIQSSLSAKGQAVITNNGQPWALMIDITDGDLMEAMRALRIGRANLAFSKLRSQSEEQGLDDLSMDDINAEIAAYRAEKRNAQAGRQ